MALIRNMGKAARVLPVGSKMVEIRSSEAVEIDDAEWRKLKARATVKQDIADGILVDEKPAKQAKSDDKSGKDEKSSEKKA